MKHSIILYRKEAEAKQATEVLRDHGFNASYQGWPPPSSSHEEGIFAIYAEKQEEQEVAESVRDLDDIPTSSIISCPDCGGINISISGAYEVSPSIRALESVSQKLDNILSRSSPTATLVCRACACEMKVELDKAA